MRRHESKMNKNPLNGELVVVRVRSFSNTTNGWEKNEDRTLFASYHKKTWPCESASFYGNFFIDDDDANWSKAEIIAWAGFSGSRKLK